MPSVLNRKVLVLNKSFVPCSVISIKRAIILLYKKFATIVDPFKHFQTFTWDDWIKCRPDIGEDHISSSLLTVRIPEVIVLNSYNKLPIQKLNFNKPSLYQRDCHTCMYCGNKPGIDQLTIDHIVPKAQGGTTSWINCCLSCVKCNSFKANRTPEQAKMNFFKPNFKPFKPKFDLFKLGGKVKSWDIFLGDMK